MNTYVEWAWHRWNQSSKHMCNTLRRLLNNNDLILLEIQLIRYKGNIVIWIVGYYIFNYFLVIIFMNFVVDFIYIMYIKVIKWLCYYYTHLYSICLYWSWPFFACFNFVQLVCYLIDLQVSKNHRVLFFIAIWCRVLGIIMVFMFFLLCVSIPILVFLFVLIRKFEELMLPLLSQNFSQLSSYLLFTFNCPIVI